MPVFVRTTVRQAIGLNGASFTEPLLQIPGLSLGLAANNLLPQRRQMSKKFGAKGVAYNVGQDCAEDVDCGVECVSSLICTPTLREGYTSKVPGRIWDSPA